MRFWELGRCPRPWGPLCSGRVFAVRGREAYAEQVTRGRALHGGALDHPLKDGIGRLRQAILGSDDRITEHIKWKAPSFRYAGEDRVTYRLYPQDRAQLVFHRGAKVRGEAADFAFEDDTGLLRWVAEDRAVGALRDAEARQRDLVELVKRWVVT
jgi:hypothetical protein